MLQQFFALITSTNTSIVMNTIKLHKTKRTIMLSQKTTLLLHAIFLLCLNTNLIGMESTNNVDTLITNPIRSINTNNTIFTVFIKELNKPQKTTQLDLTTQTNNYKSLIQKYERICPLFLLTECISEEGNTEHNNNCLLSRTYQPRYRELFENHASRLLIEKLHTSPTNTATYTSFGCGGTFQDLIIITKALIEQPKARLNIHLIDGNNTPYISAVDFLNYSREITSDQTFFDFGSQLAEYEQHARDKEKDDPEIMTMTHTALQQQLTFLCLKKEAQYKQFIRSLKQKFSLAQISLYIHDQVNNYCNYLEKNNYTHADVLTAADIEDYVSITKKGIQNYMQLCSTTLTNNPESCNAWLAKINNTSAGILTASLPNPERKKQKAVTISFDIETL